MKVMSLFSGAGGLDLGFTQAGYDIIWANDNYQPACDTIALNKKYFNAVKYDNPEEKFAGEHRIFYGDIQEIKSFKNAIGKQSIDLIIGGFPCQDFSQLRGDESKGRGGVKVKRGRLYCHFVRALAELQPKMFVAENVKGLISANQGEAYKAIIEDFEHLNDRWGDIKKEYGNFKNSKIKGNTNGFEGYHILFKDIVDFSKLGVPQKRQRLIIIGLRKDLYRKLQKLKNFSIRNFEKELRQTFFIKGNGKLSKFPITPIEIFYGKTLEDLKTEYKTIMLEFNDTIKSIKSERQKKYLDNIWSNYSMNILKDYLHENDYLPQNNNNKTLDVGLDKFPEEIKESHKNILQELEYFNVSVDILRNAGDNNDFLLDTDTVKERMKHIPPGENHEFVRNTKYHVTGLMSNIYKRIHPLKPSPTIIARGGGGTWGYHFSINRQKLTHRERARLQTFPDDYVFEGTTGQVRTQIGNAVPPLAGKRIAQGLQPLVLGLKKIS